MRKVLLLFDFVSRDLQVFAEQLGWLLVVLLDT
jgi:hypothetical protein